MMQDVPATFTNTRFIALAISWRLALVMGLWIFASAFVPAFLAYVLPYGQLEFWLLTVISNVLPERVFEYVWSHRDVSYLTVAVLIFAIKAAVDLAILFLALNWLLTRHIGREFGSFRLALQQST